MITLNEQKQCSKNMKNKLLLFEKFQERSKLIQEMNELLKDSPSQQKLSEMVTELAKLD